MTLVLSDQEIASRDCENGVLGAFQMTVCSEYWPRGIRNVDERGSLRVQVLVAL